jgi:hypothetical protein
MRHATAILKGNAASVHLFSRNPLIFLGCMRVQPTSQDAHLIVRDFNGIFSFAVKVRRVQGDINEKI